MSLAPQILRPQAAKQAIGLFGHGLRSFDTKQTGGWLQEVPSGYKARRHPDSSTTKKTPPEAEISWAGRLARLDTRVPLPTPGGGGNMVLPGKKRRAAPSCSFHAGFLADDEDATARIHVFRPDRQKDEISGCV